MTWSSFCNEIVNFLNSLLVFRTRNGCSSIKGCCISGWSKDGFVAIFKVFWSLIEIFLHLMSGVWCLMFLKTLISENGSLFWRIFVSVCWCESLGCLKCKLRATVFLYSYSSHCKATSRFVFAIYNKSWFVSSYFNKKLFIYTLSSKHKLPLRAPYCHSSRSYSCS